MLNTKFHPVHFRSNKMSNATQMGTDLASDYNFQTGEEANQDKGKPRPITRHEATKGEYTCSSTLSLTSTLDGGGWLRSWPASFNPGNDPYPL